MNRALPFFLIPVLLYQMFLPLQAQEAPTKLNIVIVEGEGAINNVRQRVNREPIIQVEDENHKPVAGAAVVFLLPNDGASGVFTNGSRTLTTTTNNQGQAVARFRPNNVQGKMQIRVTASKNGQTTSTTISQANVVAAVTGVGLGLSAKLLIILAIAGAGVAGGVVAATRGGSSNPTQPTVITPGAPGVGGPR